MSTNLSLPKVAMASDQKSRLTSATVPVTLVAAVRGVSARAGSNATPGGAASLGSTTLTKALARGVSPSASVATAVRLILRGGPAVIRAVPVASSATGFPSSVRVTAVIGATLEATAWTVIGAPLITGKL